MQWPLSCMVTAPGTVDDVDMTELLYALENHFQIISDVDPDTFYYDEGDYLLEEAAEGEVMPCSELLKLVKCTIGAVLDTEDISIPARFFDIGVDNAPASEKFFPQ